MLPGATFSEVSIGGGGALRCGQPLGVRAMLTVTEGDSAGSAATHASDGSAGGPGGRGPAEQDGDGAQAGGGTQQ